VPKGIKPPASMTRNTQYATSGQAAEPGITQEEGSPAKRTSNQEKRQRGAGGRGMMAKEVGKK